MRKMNSIRSIIGSISSSKNLDSFHPRLQQKSDDNETVLEKFHCDTIVKLETGQIKNIQKLTTNDFLISTKQSPRYSGLLARVDYIGDVDKLTGKAKLRFYIKDIEKSISSDVLQEMPFFVHQYSCWSSISPEYTRRRCGLNCRQLECGDLIIAIIEQQTIPRRIDPKPDYTQQSPIKCLVERYINEKISSSKDNFISKNKRMKIDNEC